MKTAVCNTSAEGNRVMLLVAILLVANISSSSRAVGEEQVEGLVIESSRLKLVLHENRKGIAHLIDNQTGRDYAAQDDRAFGLYSLYFGKSLEKGKRSIASNIVADEVTRIENGFRLRFEQKGTHPALVDCSITARSDQPAIHFHIDVTNRSNQALVAIDYPLFVCRSQLGESSADDRILYPQHEGILLCDPARNMPVGTSLSKAYPGSASAQFMYYFDTGGGLYCAAEDTEGFTKTLMLERERDGLSITWRHELPSVRLGRTKLAYDVVWSVGRSTWQDGADIYRTWAEENAPWCKNKIRANAAPDWLQRTNVFLNYQFDLEGEFYGAEQADELFLAYREFFGLPIVASAFGWEKHGCWIGPDYFPPRGGEDYYRDLSQRLVARGDHMHLFTSGFRWSVRKTVSQLEKGGTALVQTPGYRRDRTALPSQNGGNSYQARTYTDYDGLTEFYRRGQLMSATDGYGASIYEQSNWADNRLLCAGCLGSREMLASCFTQLYDYGIAGVNLDQNLGAGIPHCYSERHDHPPGPGRWQFRSMFKFLEDVRLGAREEHPDSFIGVEEPCEMFIPVVDIVHGRAFTDTVWPAAGPGAVSVPLYLYLYHQYQLHYAGWIDSGFSPVGDVRFGIGRAAIFGMQPGVRIGKGPFQYRPAQPASEPPDPEPPDPERPAPAPPTPELLMLRNAARITHRCQDYLLLGRMLHDPVIKGSPAVSNERSEQRPPLPVAWPVVQATAWQSEEGNVCYAIVNLSESKRTVQLLTQSYGNKTAQRVSLTRINADNEQVLQSATGLPVRVTLGLEPWQICCVEQREIAEE